MEKTSRYLNTSSIDKFKDAELIKEIRREIDSKKSISDEHFNHILKNDMHRTIRYYARSAKNTKHLDALLKYIKKVPVKHLNLFLDQIARNKNLNKKQIIEIIKKSPERTTAQNFFDSKVINTGELVDVAAKILGKSSRETARNWGILQWFEDTGNDFG